MAEPKVLPVNQSVAFLKEADVLTTDLWHVAVDLNLSVYHDVMSAISSDLILINQERKKFTSASELSQVAILLHTLEDKFSYLLQLLPKPDRCHGILNFGGTLLRTLFGTATLGDVHQLHETIDRLRTQNADIVHSLTSQVTYVRQLDHSTRVNTQSIANMSSVIKDVIVQASDKLKEVTKDVVWLNITLRNQNELFMKIWQLKFSLLFLIQQVDELFAAVQSVLCGKLPMYIIGPNVLHNILCNVSLQLPKNY
jgi:hypothetical protein